jgi:hypothetical protein
MPKWKYLGNRCLTFVENLLLRAKLSEYHTSYRGVRSQFTRTFAIETNFDDFVFGNQILPQMIALGYPIGEVTCPARCCPEASSINFRRSVHYGLGCLATGTRFAFACWRRAHLQLGATRAVARRFAAHFDSSLIPCAGQIA